MAGLEPSSLPRELSQGPGMDFEGFVRFMEGFVEGSTTSLQEAVRRHPQARLLQRCVPVGRLGCRLWNLGRRAELEV